MINLISIYVDYKKDTNLKDFNIFYEFIKNLKSNLTVIYINNYSNKFLIEYFKNSNIIYMESNNLQEEFSAWDDGINYIKKINIDFDFLLFANSAYPNYHSFDHYDNNEIIKILKFADLAGIKHFFHPSMNIEFKKNKFSCWINTSFFILSKRSLKYLNYKLNNFQVNLYDENDKFNLIINKVCNIGLYTHIDNWISSHAKYDGRYRKKFLNILNEKFISCQIEKNKKLKVIDFNDIKLYKKKCILFGI